MPVYGSITVSIRLECQPVLKSFRRHQHESDHFRPRQTSLPARIKLAIFSLPEAAMDRLMVDHSAAEVRRHA